MDEPLRARALDAADRLDAALAAGAEARHAEIRAGIVAAAGFRDALARACREGRAERAALDCANAALSLGYGALFPLAGLHLDRVEATRDALRALADGGSED